MTQPVLYYIYPLTKWVSFKTVAEAHVRELRKYFRVVPIEENSLLVVIPMTSAISKCAFFVHPYFYPMQRFEKKLLVKIKIKPNIIGVDVADSDHISEIGVRLTRYAKAMIVPSKFSQKTYIRSGVVTPVFAVPHGVDSTWLGSNPSRPQNFRPLMDYKTKNNKKLIQSWIMHSSYRKGEDLLYQIYNNLLSERNDVALVIRRPFSIDIYDQKIDPNNLTPQHSIPLSWLTDDQIKELMDTCDIFCLTSRGGGFEHPPLLAMARGELVIGARGGAWEDYMPEWSLVPSHRSDVVIPNNPIHDGCGVELEVDQAVNKLHDILNNMDDYKAKIQQHIETHIKPNLTWEKIGERLKNIVIGLLGANQ